MPVIKCKMCGGDMELSPDKTFGTCEYCGSTMTLPKVDDEQRAAAFNRGNHFRRIGEFDKALSVYERIVQEDETDAEAHWCCALCRFGIEYVEDPATYEWLPTCHRASFDSFLEDVDYLAALKYSDGITRRQYQRDGVKIAEVQRGILATSQNEEPFDVFLCYKESDENGNRTVDSTLAQDIYYQLTNQGRRVFFARITLEDKAGAQYEPYIFAALNSAKVMIAVGTKPEHFNAVWVKNEWSRFLSLMKKDRSKLLLPCYRDMDPYDLPEQLSVLQSYDMGKIGFIQDLIRGVNKVLDADKQPEPAKETVVVQQSGGANIEAILKRGRMALEDGEWEKADKFWEEVLNQDAECAEAYTGKLLADNQCRTLQAYIQKLLAQTEKAEAETLSAAEPEEGRVHSAVRRYSVGNYLGEERIVPLYQYDLTYPSILASRREQAEEAKRNFEDNKLLRRAFRFAKGAYQEQLETIKRDYFAALDARIAQAEKEDSARIEGIRAAYGEHLDKADQEAEALFQEASTRREQDYQEAVNKQSGAKTEEDYTQAAELFRRIGSYQDSEDRQKNCLARAKAAGKRKTKGRILIGTAAVLAVAVFLLVTKVIIPAVRYSNAVSLMESENYGEAIVAFETVEDYRDSREKISECENGLAYQSAYQLMTEGSYEEAISAFRALNGYRDSTAKITECETAIRENTYQNACQLMAEERYEEALADFESLDGYRDSTTKITECESIIQENTYQNALTLKKKGKEVEALSLLDTIEGYPDAEQLRKEILADIREKIAPYQTVVSAGGGKFSDYTIGLKTNGTVVAVGRNDAGQCDVTDWRNIVAVSAGGVHAVGLKSDGTVVAVGRNNEGQCDVSDWRDIVAVSAGYYHTVGLKADGTVVAVGDHDDGRCDVSDWRDIVAVSAGWSHTVGLKADGTVVAVGYNDDGRCDVADWRDIVAVSTGSWHTVGLKTDGTVVAVGYNQDNQCDVSEWKNIVAVSAGEYHTVGLKADGTVAAVGYHGDGQCRVSGWRNIVAVFANNRYTVGRKSDGTVVAVGDNDHGQCDVSGWENIGPAK